MSAHSGAFEADVDLESNVATIDLFDDGECRLGEDGDDWWGIVSEDGAYYWVDTRDLPGIRPMRFRIGEQAVRDLIRSALAGDIVVHPEPPEVAP